MANFRLNDPNKTNSPFPNGFAKIETQFIYAELKAERRGSTVLDTSTGEASTQSGVLVSLMGYDPNTNSYTTKISGNDSSLLAEYENFGITNIKVITNSSFVPKVTIEFVDIKGATVYNKTGNSPYSIIMSFPPPIFTLSLKGYYGKTLEYKLHLVKQNTRLDSATGNYVVNVDFVGQTYAPLSDVLLKYITLAPFLKTDTLDATNNVDLSDFVAPKTTFELIARTKKLYNQISEFKDNSKDIQKINNITDNLTTISIALSFLNNFKTEFSDLKDNIFMGIKAIDNFSDANPISVFQNAPAFNTLDDGSDSLVVITNINEFDKALKLQIPYKTNFKDRVLLFVKKSGNGAGNENDTTIALLEAFRDKLINITNNIKSLVDSNIRILEVTTGDFKILSNIIEYTNNTETPYICLDLTKYYSKVFQYREKIDQIKRESSDLVFQEINELALRNLGMIPTIYNVFKILCDDVDTFFDVLRDTAFRAEEHHNSRENYNRILSSFNKTLKGSSPKIFAWPTYIENNERKYIGTKFDYLSEQFPEVELVERFILSFFTQQFTEDNLLKEDDEFGNKKYIPISPTETNLQSNSSVTMPYSGLLKEDDVFNKAVERYMVASQFTYNGLFIDGGIIDYVRNINSSELIKFVANSEARNLTNSLIDIKLIQRLSLLAKQYSLNVENFYTENPYYNQDSVAQNVNVGITITPDRTSDTYVGFEYINDFDVIERTPSNDIVDEFLDNNSNLLDKVFKIRDTTIFTKENLLLYKDLDIGDNYNSKYISTVFSKQQELTEVYSKQISVSENDVKLLAKLNNNTDFDNSIKIFSILSLFGGAVSLFRINTGTINNLFIAGMYELPLFALGYMGGLVKYYSTSNTNETVDLFFEDFYSNVDSFFINEEDKDFVQNLSDIDKSNLLLVFNQIVDQYGDFVISKFISILDVVSIQDDVDFVKQRKYVTAFLNDADLLPLLSKRNYLVNYSTITFYNGDETFEFIPVKNTDNAITTKYFKQFFQSLTNLLEDKVKNIEDRQRNFVKSIDDNDVKNQIYYSFKSLNDRWISGLKTKERSGFPFNDSGTLIDTFRFIDRAGIDIGGKSDLTSGLNTGCVIDISPLVDLSEDLDVSVFTVFSKLLAHNGFEFFPMTNYISFDENSTEYSDELFKINENVTRVSQPAFVCMYIGNTSSYLNDDSSDYKDDGIYFSKDREGGGNVPADMQNDGVNAFIVSYGSQNQSLFNQIELNTNEHKETNESLKILSELASDRSNSTPVAKAQNLYNTYEQRSYTCTVVTHGGNMMIQPTQYFELQNTPMFNGAYIILGVEHDVVPNKITTKFTGVRISQYKSPIVTSFAVTVGGMLGVDSSITSGGSDPISFGNITLTNIEQNLPLNPKL